MQLTEIETIEKAFTLLLTQKNKPKKKAGILYTKENGRVFYIDVDLSSDLIEILAKIDHNLGIKIILKMQYQEKNKIYCYFEKGSLKNNDPFNDF